VHLHEEDAGCLEETEAVKIFGIFFLNFLKVQQFNFGAAKKILQDSRKNCALIKKKIKFS
jgi:hypothetical protein